MNLKTSYIAIAAAVVTMTLAVAGNAGAGPLGPTDGMLNPTLYSFTAANSGSITAYFAGSGASYTNELTMLVNGVSTGIQGLNNQTSTVGQSLVLGSVTAGDSIVFKLIVVSANGPYDVGPWYSDKSRNSDGVNHIYSSDFAGDKDIPKGTYVAFEDLIGGGDLNYNDLDFVFVNTTSTANSLTTVVPEPPSFVLLGAGLVGLAVIRKRFCAKVATQAARS